jgi:hypothetical protein
MITEKRGIVTSTQHCHASLAQLVHAGLGIFCFFLTKDWAVVRRHRPCSTMDPCLFPFRAFWIKIGRKPNGVDRITTGRIWGG